MPVMTTMRKPPARSEREMKRITLHIDASTKALLQQAADASGLHLAEFVRIIAVARAQRLLSQTSATRVSNDEFYQVLDAIENPPAPTDDLVEALRPSR
ncbi:MAG: DUF1778 domain-containing protein [Alloalcanivorax venustensis]|jgi:uncharacterized protein (DUF1778 family)|uniref:type II toxin-antitoxin system TacA family antitoxin n=1 Tax=Alloalcanivorax venustensis TaxID=172371 RepID=UPI0030013043|tara:strand:+ start:5123 stop:5419 length:297 start_codon:yes stop_codon:yes gene_type:complete